MKDENLNTEETDNSDLGAVSRSFDELTEIAKQTTLGQKIMSEMNPMEMWVNDISPDGKIIGRLEMISGRYENCG